MITIGLPCDHCRSMTVAHCNDARCGWSRCTRCHSYGFPGRRFIKWNSADYMNPYTLYDVKVAEPDRKMPEWLSQSYGIQRDTDG